MLLKWLKGISSQTKPSGITAPEKNGFVSILIHVQTQGVASESQRTERKKNYTPLMTIFFFPLTCYFVLLCSWKDFLQLTREERVTKSFFHASCQLMNFTNVHLKLSSYIQVNNK